MSRIISAFLFAGMALAQNVPPSGGGSGNATTVNGASVPASQDCVGTNSSSQIVAGSCSGLTTAYTTVSYSATPTFTVTASTSIQDFAITLTGNVTNSTLTLTNATTGQDIAFKICQDATGSRTFVWPTNVLNPGAIPTAASTCGKQVFRYDGSNAVAFGPMVSDSATAGVQTPSGFLAFPSGNGTFCLTTGTCGTGPQFRGYTFVVDSNAASVTSPSMTVTTGDLLVVNCRFATGSVGTATDSASNSYTALTARNLSGTGAQMSWAIAGTTASITFTCTQSGSAAGISLVALDFSGTGSTANTSAGGTANLGSTVPGVLTSPAFTTSQRTLDIFCGAVSSVSGQFATNAIAGIFGPLAGVSASTLSGTPDQGCNFALVPYAVPGAIASINYGAAANSTAYTVLAINY